MQVHGQQQFTTGYIRASETETRLRAGTKAIDLVFDRPRLDFLNSSAFQGKSMFREDAPTWSCPRVIENSCDSSIRKKTGFEDAVNGSEYRTLTTGHVPTDVGRLW